MKTYILVFAAVIGCCQSITAYALSATLKILPQQYLVNESAFESPAAAASAVLEMKPTSIDIEACNGMATQRVIDVMEILMTQYPVSGIFGRCVFIANLDPFRQANKSHQPAQRAMINRRLTSADFSRSGRSAGGRVFLPRCYCQ